MEYNFKTFRPDILSHCRTESIVAEKRKKQSIKNDKKYMYRFRILSLLNFCIIIILSNAFNKLENIIEIKIFRTSCSFSVKMNNIRLPPLHYFPRSPPLFITCREKSRTKNRSQVLINVYYSGLAVEAIHNYANLLQMNPILWRLILKIFKFYYIITWQKLCNTLYT
jgi:hypothetical protein